jgi:hypothetical protein
LSKKRPSNQTFFSTTTYAAIPSLETLLWKAVKSDDLKFKLSFQWLQKFKFPVAGHQAYVFKFPVAGHQAYVSDSM